MQVYEPADNAMTQSDVQELTPAEAYHITIGSNFEFGTELERQWLLVLEETVEVCGLDDIDRVVGVCVVALITLWDGPEEIRPQIGSVVCSLVEKTIRHLLATHYNTHGVLA